MVRRKIKGTKVRRTLSPSEEPNFYDHEWTTAAARSDSLGHTEPALPAKNDRVVVSSVPPPSLSAVAESAEVSDDDSFDMAIEEVVCDGELVFFEGSPFHFLGSADLDLEDHAAARSQAALAGQYHGATFAI